MARIPIGIIILAICSLCQSETILVGPDQAVMRIADAARLARDGDDILVSAGVYRGDVAVWRQKFLTIRSVGGNAILVADGMSAEGKAIWVIRGGHFDIHGFEFRGTRVPSGNGAGIRFERGTLTLTDCVFRDNQMGLLTGNDPDSVLRIRDTWFADAPRQERSLPHLLYVGRIKAFEAIGSRFENGYRGHLLKSRARRTELRANLIADPPDGQASYEVDLPNGGEAILVGNLIIQSPRSENKTLIAYGAEGMVWPYNRLVMAHNTLMNVGDEPALFLRSWDKIQSPDQHTSIQTRNNLLLGLGAPMETLPGDHLGNISCLEPEQAPLDLAEFRLTVRRLRGKTRIEPQSMARELVPTEQFEPPLGRVPIKLDHVDWLPGALQGG